MAQFQPMYTSYPPPAMMMNTPTPIMGGYTYGQYPSMQYYPSAQPSLIQQTNGYYHHGGGYIRQHHTCIECCLGLLCLGVCTWCCADQCCGTGDDYCYNGGDHCCGAC